MGDGVTLAQLGYPPHEPRHRTERLCTNAALCPLLQLSSGLSGGTESAPEQALTYAVFADMGSINADMVLKAPAAA